MLTSIRIRDRSDSESGRCSSAQRPALRFNGDASASRRLHRCVALAPKSARPFKPTANVYLAKGERSRAIAEPHRNGIGQIDPTMSAPRDILGMRQHNVASARRSKFADPSAANQARPRPPRRASRPAWSDRLDHHRDHASVICRAAIRIPPVDIDHATQLKALRRSRTPRHRSDTDRDQRHRTSTAVAYCPSANPPAGPACGVTAAASRAAGAVALTPRDDALPSA